MGQRSNVGAVTHEILLDLIKCNNDKIETIEKEQDRQCNRQIVSWPSN